jgi:Transposase IS4
LKPIAVGALPEGVNLNKNKLPDLPDYTPPLNLRPEPPKSLVIGLPELQTFQLLLTPLIVNEIVKATNSYAYRAREEIDTLEDHDRDEIEDLKFSVRRPWSPVNSVEIWRYIGCQLYMGIHKEGRREDYWELDEKKKQSRLGRSLSLVRYEQIYRYFTL